MPLRVLFTAFIVLQLPVYAALMALSYRTHPTLFYGAEILLLIDIAAAIAFYRRVMRPLRTLGDALDHLRSQDWNMALRPTGQPEVDRLVGVFNAMMQSLHDQRVLMREQTHFLTLLVDVSPAGIVVCDFDGSTLMRNPAADRLLGKDTLPASLRALPDGGTTTLRLPDGKILQAARRHFVQEGVKRTFYTVENITSAVDMAEKEAYDKLIRLMAHEVNNTVAGLSTALDTLVSGDPDTDELLGACRDRALALSDFIGRFAEVVKIPAPRPEEIDLAAAVRRFSPFLESLCTTLGASFSTHIPDTPIAVSADATMLEQVLVNIVKNGAESAGAGGK